jgi:hypothetical protein
LRWRGDARGMSLLLNPATSHEPFVIRSRRKPSGPRCGASCEARAERSDLAARTSGTSQRPKRFTAMRFFVGSKPVTPALNAGAMQGCAACTLLMISTNSLPLIHFKA